MDFFQKKKDSFVGPQVKGKKQRCLSYPVFIVMEVGGQDIDVRLGNPLHGMSCSEVVPKQ